MPGCQPQGQTSGALPQAKYKSQKATHNTLKSYRKQCLNAKSFKVMIKTHAAALKE